MLSPVVDSSLIKLRYYHQEHFLQLQSFYLTPSQLKFTVLPTDVLAIAIKDPYRFPIVIELKGVPVGFFILHHGPEVKEYTNNSQAILLRAFSVNLNDQGKGYATNALTELPQFLKREFPDFNEVVLAVNKGNKTAINLYKKLGFHYQGRKRYGFMGLQYILHFSLKLKRRI
ncbi:GNAT family N-acetyltransferase [Litchfieldia salsa]|uniref:Protein N-acetyltransferase, RimJ/RimL family n=1 Tax=Litchfieldia salsa TaxID=930152 RepID=A0A1H0U8M2_9BACI|nr:GNAT family protein [Litchfieldia salsa]SDP62338.1 Protein N-acetyltransferase, RimJ/RimL family [Litchfieldia salsa]